MSAHIIDSALYRDQFGTAEMREIFSDHHLVQCWLKVEAALARAEAQVGLIPEDAARKITESAQNGNLDFAEMKRGVNVTGHPLVPFITAFSQACPDGSGEFVHWGATTQDIMDTAAVLQIREAYYILKRQLDALVATLADLARRYRDTPMAGRTHGQHALPITFGFKIAVLIAEFHRHGERLEQLRPRVFVTQLSGAVGTLASLRGSAASVQEGFARELDLQPPLITWHTARDGIAEFLSVVSMIGQTCAKAANEVIHLQKTELAEVEEPNTEENIGSSTMPQKRNPMLSESVVALGRIIRHDAALALECMVQEHERDMSAWQAEWEFIPEACVLASGALDQSLRIFAGLAVRPEQMSANLQLSEGLINAEAIMMALAPHIGRQQAHEIVRNAARASFDTGRTFSQCLIERPEIVAVLNTADVEALLRPDAYLGQSHEAVDRVLDMVEK
jgi:3-carboxy-cis,cis-muconate cycloisomerase